MKQVTIVGGGLAGLALGIGLRRAGIPTLVIESGRYPRHRVCGEFISGNGLLWLDSNGLTNALRKNGALEARLAVFFHRGRATPVRRLPHPAICLSRWTLDATLAEVFQAEGGQIQTDTRFTGPWTEGIVRATGRRPATGGTDWRHFGLKAHVSDLDLNADLEMHLGRTGYVGLSRVENRRVNVCGLFRSRHPVPGLNESWKSWLAGPQDSPLAARLASATWHEESACAVAGLGLAPRSAASHDELSIGDAVTMIPPVTGNGMSMAFESAALATPPVIAWARGSLTWTDARRAVAERLDEAFSSRLRWAARLQNALFSPSLPALLLAGLEAWPSLWTHLFFLARSPRHAAQIPAPTNFCAKTRSAG